jgi:ribosomal-protein-alanine N-acetyltransferase
LPALLEIEQVSFPSPHWTANDFLLPEVTVAELDGEVVGFLVVRETFPGGDEVPPEREILNLAVALGNRRCGVASSLLREELSRRAHFFLEVRESNLTAQALYRKFGFVEIGRRPEYYLSPRETAIVMGMKWC